MRSEEIDLHLDYHLYHMTYPTVYSKVQFFDKLNIQLLFNSDINPTLFPQLLPRRPL